jgi:hypothetical protein
MNLRAISAVDTYAARYLPFSIWRNHTLVLDPIAKTVRTKIAAPEGDADAAWWICEGREGHLISFYPIVAGDHRTAVLAGRRLPARLGSAVARPRRRIMESLSRRCSRRRQSCFFTS